MSLPILFDLNGCKVYDARERGEIAAEIPRTRQSRPGDPIPALSSPALSINSEKARKARIEQSAKELDALIRC